MGDVYLEATPQSLKAAKQMMLALIDSYDWSGDGPTEGWVQLSEHERAEFLMALLIAIGTLFLGMGVTKDAAIKSLVECINVSYQDPSAQPTIES